jgi:ComF family protein
MDIIKFIKDIIAPKRCYSCQKEWHFLCQDCLQKRQLQKEFCYVCKKESKNYFLHTDCKKWTIFENFEKIIILLHYNDSYIAKLIKDSKFNKKKDILEDFAYYLLDLLRKNENRKEEYTIVVPPMYFLKKWKRGYNHSELLGKYIAKIGWIPYDFSLVKKIKYTRQQSHLSKEQREKNILHSFVCTQYGKEKIQWKNIILVDDVISTGATLWELAKILKQNWAKKIIALVIASD